MNYDIALPYWVIVNLGEEVLITSVRSGARKSVEELKNMDGGVSSSHDWFVASKTSSLISYSDSSLKSQKLCWIKERDAWAFQKVGVLIWMGRNQMQLFDSEHSKHLSERMVYAIFALTNLIRIVFTALKVNDRSQGIF